MKPTADQLRVAGLVRLSSCDWPGQLAATVFCQGCGWSCPYCHNPALRDRNSAEGIDWREVESFLRRRAGLLDAVVFSGGEPTLQPALGAAMETAKRMSFRVGLHTAGPSPRRLAPLMPWLDWVGFDVKAPFAEYARITGVAESGTAAHTSLQLLLASGVELEVRTTVHGALLSAEDIAEMRRELQVLGVRRYVVQEFRSEGVEPEKLLQFPVVALPVLDPDFGSGFSSFQMR